MELHEALSQIAEIRQQVARTEIFRGYRAVPVAFSGLLAFVTAGIQAWIVQEPGQDTPTYLMLWISAALLSLLATGLAMAWHLRRSSSTLERDKLLIAVSQFLPCVAAGGLLAVVLARFAPESLWMLPGLWAMLFGLGIFASWRFLPHPVVFVGVFYVLVGALVLAWAQGEWAFSPWAMGLPFGVGQLLAAAVLYWTLERTDEQI